MRPYCSTLLSYICLLLALIAVPSYSNADSLPECGSHEAQTKLHEKIDQVSEHHNLFGEAYVTDVEEIKEDYRMCSATVVLNTGYRRQISYGFKAAPEGAEPLVTLSLDYDPEENYHNLKELLARKNAEPYDLLGGEGGDQIGVPVAADDFLRQSQGSEPNPPSRAAGNGFTIERRQSIDRQTASLLALIVALLACAACLHIAKSRSRLPSEAKRAQNATNTPTKTRFNIRNLATAMFGICAFIMVAKFIEGGAVGIEYSGEFPNCQDQKAIEHVQAAFNEGPSGMQGVRIIQIAEPREVMTASDRRDCSGIAVLNIGSEYRVAYGFENHYDRVLAHISLQEPLQ